MFGSNTLEIAIGLALAYLSLSLVVTAANELWAGLTRSRARDLERGIRNLLDGTSTFPRRWWNIGTKPHADSRKWGDLFFQHQLIDALSQDGQKPSYIPSNIFAMVVFNMVAQSAAQSAGADNATQDETLMDPGTIWGFASFDQLADAVSRIDNVRLKQAMLPMIEEARTDMTDRIAATAKMRVQVERWFDHAMDRVSGWYKRRTQWVLFGIALFVAATLNVDTVAICRHLASDSTLRESVVAAAGRAAATTRPATTQPGTGDIGDEVRQVGDAVGRVAQLGIPLGWKAHQPGEAERQKSKIEGLVKAADESTTRARTLQADYQSTVPAEIGDPQYAAYRDKWITWKNAGEQAAQANLTLENAGKLQAPAPDPRDDDLYGLWQAGLPYCVTKVLGLLLTAFAASLGAPFWFDLLNKFMSVRAAGKAPEEQPKDPKKVLQPTPPGPAA